MRNLRYTHSQLCASEVWYAMEKHRMEALAAVRQRGLSNQHMFSCIAWRGISEDARYPKKHLKVDW